MNPIVDIYMEKAPNYALPICRSIRFLILKNCPGIIEDFKWRFPIYKKNRIIFAFGAFKDHVTLTFFQGTLLKDKHNILIDTGNEHNKSLKFRSVEEIDDLILSAYIREAFENDAKGLVAKERIIDVPVDLKQALAKNGLKEKFDNMNFTTRKEFVNNISAAKTMETRIKKIDQIIKRLEK